MKGIILAGGSGPRLYPVTSVTCKQLLPIYDKPMVYYPLSVLMLAGIREIMIISTPKDVPRFRDLFGEGKELGLSVCYEEQPVPRGVADAFIIGEKFIRSESVCLILGDNFFYGDSFPDLLRKVVRENEGATVFGYYVKEPQRYGVLEFESDRVISIEEKSENPKSNYAIVGLYFHNQDVVRIAKSIKPSARGELEITDVNRVYLEEEERQGLRISCIEEIAYRMGYIDKKQLAKHASNYKNEYGEYLAKLLAQ